MQCSTCALLLFVVIVAITSSKIAKSFSNSRPIIISRDKWGARVSAHIEYCLIPIKFVIIHHTATPTCTKASFCADLLTRMQHFHMDNLHFHDIGYNFLIGGNGQIYEGTGWHKVGAHTKGFNSRSLGIAFVGNFSNKLPNAKQLEAVKQLLRYGVEVGELEKKYRLFGARQVSATQSPGLRLYQEIQTWDHFTRSP